MTNNEKEQIIKLRNTGLGYKKISSELNIPVSTVRYVCSQPLEFKEAEYCLFCGKEMHSIEGKKKKKFCCDKCRYDYWNRMKRGAIKHD